FADKEKKKSKSKTVLDYPISIFFIVVNEFCERFSYYGMRTVLVLYLNNFLNWDEDFATTIYHTFVALCYLTPILGAIVADSWLGKYKTIVYLSIVYAVGQVVLAVSAIHDITDTNRDGTPDNMTFHVALSMVGLVLIALGTGGIKPCVAAFGGDQFEDHQEKQRGTFFSIFYISINAGSLLSTIITPILKAQECGIYTHQQCYPLAFGVPAALMFVALVVFIVGSPMYTKTAPQGNIMVKFCKCVGFAIKNRFRHRSSQYPKRAHWMDWAEEKYDKLLIAQVKMVLKVLFLYIPLPMFWALFDQQGSRWTLQATTMDGKFGSLEIQPEHMQTVNPILILVLVPIMDTLIYPLISKCKLNFSPLKRMTVGMLLASVAFVAAALVQLEIDKTLPDFPAGEESQVKFVNMLNEKINFTAGDQPFSMEPFTARDNYTTFTGAFNLSLGARQLQRDQVQWKHSQHPGDHPGCFCSQFSDINKKPEKGKNAIKFLTASARRINVTARENDFGFTVPNNMSAYQLLHSGDVNYKIMTASGRSCVFSQTLKYGSSYTIFIRPDIKFEEQCTGVHAVMDISPNTVTLALQIPQYFFITAGEVVFSVTGLEFAYSQSPSNMKAVLQAGWLLTVAVGNIIVLIVAEAATLEEQWAEYILFASLLVLVCIIFAIMAYFYTYIDPVKIESQFAHCEPEEEKKKKRSLEMVGHGNGFRKRSDSSSSDETTT
uniref:Solute carrier family 15 member 1b n=1 Tax=Tetraodon nigroviridis TaxID=99883 RepID=H3C9A9_TETNG